MTLTRLLVLRFTKGAEDMKENKMRIINQDQNVQVNNVESYLNSSESSLTHKSYHELSDSPVHEMDALAQLHNNLELLSDLSGRLSFVMREVRYLMKA